jgi:hypothetical protein
MGRLEPERRAMIESLQHRVDVPDGKGEVFSLPCDSDREVVVALVPVDGKLAFSDRLFVTHRVSGGRLISVEFPPCDAGLARARRTCDELLALPIDWSSSVVSLQAALTSDEARQRHVEIQRSAVLWVSNFWTMVDDGGEDE